MSRPIRLYTWTTPNGRKISIALEELGLPYEVVPIDIGRDEQFDPAFLAISPNNKIPAIVDGEVSLMESGAILLYLAEKTGTSFPEVQSRPINLRRAALSHRGHAFVFGAGQAPRES